MVSRAINGFYPTAAAGVLLLALAFASVPAKAHHDADIVAPLAAFIAFGALAHHSHQHRHHHGHHGHHGHGYRPYYRPYPRHSHSHGGYYNPPHKRHRNW